MAAVSDHHFEHIVALDDHHVVDAANETQDNAPSTDRDAVPHHHCSVGVSDAAYPAAIIGQLATLDPFPPVAFALPSLSAAPLTEPPSA